NAGGDLPDVRLFNEGGEFIGIKVDPGSVGDGSTGTIKVEHKDQNGQQAAYALFSANDNAVCVTSISITWPNGDHCLWIDSNGGQQQTGFQVHFPEFVSK
ncbi:hypothetical protein C8A05DRAFT_34415, partial [Staphylotrichum tortipilum]